MNTFTYIANFLYKIRCWIIIFPIIIALLAYFIIKDAPQEYNVRAEIYTGIFSEVNFNNPEQVNVNWDIKNNTMENLLKIITSYNTLTNVSLRLISQHLTYGNENLDNSYINSGNYKQLLEIVPKEVLVLVDRSSEERTFQKLLAYKQKSKDNFFNVLFDGDSPYYSYKGLLENMKVNRLGVSDIVGVEYSSFDPGITYHTVDLLDKEFIKQYEEFYSAQTNSIVFFLKEELNQFKEELQYAEDSLFEYNLDKQIINYEEQTKNIVAMNWELESDYQKKLLQRNSSAAIIAKLESQMREQVDKFKNNADFIAKLDEISNLSLKMYKYKLTGSDSEKWQVDWFSDQLANAEIELKKISDRISQQSNTPDGIPVSNLLDKWFEQNLELVKSESEMHVIQLKRDDLGSKYNMLLQAGSTLKERERVVDSKEKNYLSLLNNLNSAQLKQKSLVLVSDNFKTLTPPAKLAGVLSNKKTIQKVLFVFVGSFIFITGFFLLLELLNKRLQNKIKAERLTSKKVLGVLPVIDEESDKRQLSATQYLGNSVLQFIRTGQLNIINLISIDVNEGKTFIGKQLVDQFESIDLRVKYFTWNKNFYYKSKKYLLAQNISELYANRNDDVIIVEHPPLNKCVIPENLLQEAQINILIINASKKWKELDQLFVDQIANKSGDVPFFIYLNKSRRGDASTLF